MAHTMIDHVSLGTKQLDDAIQFYKSCFSTLGYRLEHQTKAEAAFGTGGKWVFWLYAVAANDSTVGARSHVAVTANSRDDVVSFFEAALRNGATSVRPPGERPDIAPNYFGTVIRDLDGHTVEAVHWTE
jgi:catechol 2,3-dioxygenase-like lactoylglutathione lyase family enzyme